MLLDYHTLNTLYPVERLLTLMGLDKVKDRGDYISFSSPFREDKNPSMVLYKKTLQCIDFASNYKSSLFSFTKELTGTNLFDLTGVDKNRLNDALFNKSLDIRELKFNNAVKSVTISGTPLPVESSPEAMKYCTNRGISEAFIKYFDISFSRYLTINGTVFSNRLLIPIRAQGKIVSVEGRDVTGKQKPKVLYPKGGSMSTLFNIDSLDRKKPLVVVEGIMDVVPLWSHFTKNVTTTFGINITANQRELLSEFEEVILFPDGDDAGGRMIDAFENFYPSEFKIALVEGKDPGESTHEEISNALSNTTSATKYLLDKVGLFKDQEETVFQFD